MKMNTIILIIATLSSGLIAGLFYAWSISVTPGLAKITDESYLVAFQSMNRAILNPAFFIFFFGLLLLLPLLCYLYYQAPAGIQFWCILAATVLYLLGVMAITILGNVPMNNTLEGLQIGSMTPQEMESFRLGFESKWNNLNMIRTICSSLALLSLLIACVQNSVK
ncbi:MAG: DUF1772 domain-containing protein [Flavobacteriales bacterium]|nr:DUF1772 domain-containing protein [Flavobacteriales bacterium]